MSRAAAYVLARPLLLRVITALCLVTALLILAAPEAHAEDPQNPDANQLGGVQDSHGVPAEKYKVLPFDRGGMDNMSKMAIGIYVDILWPFLTDSLNFVMWFFKWLLSFEWVTVVTSPLEGFAVTVQTLFGGLNWIPFALALSGLVYGWQIAKGRYSHGSINLVTTAIVAALLTGILANPATTILGENGWLKKSINGGGQVAVAIATDGANQTAAGLTAQDVIDQSFNQQLTDIFMREPAMYVSFGKKLTGECESVFDTKMKEVKTGDSGDNRVRDAVAACDPEAKFFIEHPSGQINVLGGVMLSMLLLVIMAMVLGLVLIATVVYLGFRVIKLIPSGYAALLPGEERGGFWQDLAAVAASLAMMVASLAVLVLYLRFVIEIMNALDSLGPNKFVLLGFLYIGGAVLIFSFRKRLLAWGNKVAAKMSSFMGAKNSGASQPVNGRQVIKGTQQAVRTAQSIKTSNALSSQAKGGGLSTAVSGAGVAGTAASKAVKTAGGPKLQKVLSAASKVPGLAPVAKGVQVATVVIPKAQAFAEKAKEATRRVTHEPTRRTARNESLRQKVSKADEQLERKKERIHTKLDAVDNRQSQGRHISRPRLEAKESQLREKLAAQQSSDRAEKLRARLAKGTQQANRYEERAAARRANG
ncbi:hypothetical protein V3C33_20875 (plasmid) [Micrococcaceae bacterium Sec5.7]